MDYIIKALALDNHVRVYLANTTEIANEAKKRHDLWPGALSVLSKTLTVNAMMGSMLKDHETVSIIIDGNGSIGQIHTDANSKGEVRGYVTYPHVHFYDHNQNTLNDTYALGNEGYIQVIKDLKLKDLFTSQVPIVYSDLAQDFAYYFNVSEQTPTALSLGILINEDNYAQHSGGLLVQLLPNTPDEVITKLENIFSNLPPMSKLLAENDSLEDILEFAFKNDYNILDKHELSFKCSCTKERFLNGIKSLGVEEMKEIISTEDEIETICHFCHEKYYFNKDDLIQLIKEIENDRLMEVKNED